MRLGRMWSALPVVRGKRRQRGIRDRLDALQELRSLGLPPFSESVLSPPLEMLTDELPHAPAGGRLSAAEDQGQ